MEKIRKITIVIGMIVVVLIIFEAGIFVGFRKAQFSSGLGNNYSRTFGGMRGGFMHDDIPGGHGVVGKIIKIEPSGFIVEGTDNIEKTIALSSTTLVRKFRDVASTTDLLVNTSVIILGTPGTNGTIDAKLIRILPPLK